MIDLNDPLTLINVFFHAAMVLVMMLSTYLTAMNYLNGHLKSYLLRVESFMIPNLFVIGICGTILGAYLGFELGGDGGKNVVSGVSFISTLSACISYFAASALKGLRCRLYDGTKRRVSYG